jgi:hypothetical protein
LFPHYHISCLPFSNENYLFPHYHLSCLPFSNQNYLGEQVILVAEGETT